MRSASRVIFPYWAVVCVITPVKYLPNYVKAYHEIFVKMPNLLIGQENQSPPSGLEDLVDPGEKCTLKLVILI